MTTEIKHFYEFGPYRLDTRQQMLWREGEAVVLTLKSFELLKALVSRAGEVLSREELQELVWPESYVDENNLTQHISLLRKALGEATDARQFIETLPRRGYRFIAPVRELTEQSGAIVQQEEHIKARVVVEEPSAAPNNPAAPRKLLALPAGVLKLARQPVTWAASVGMLAAALLLNRGLPGRTPAPPLLLTTLDDQRGAIRGAQFSRDGKEVAWDRDGNLWLRAVGGERSLQLTADEWLDECPVWSAAGEQLAFVSNRGGQPGLWRIHRLGGTPVLLYNLAGLRAAPTAVRPRLILWRQALWFEWDGELYRWQEGLAAAQKVTAGEAGHPTKDFAVSADEQWLAYQAGQAQQGEIWQRKIAGGAAQQLTTNNIEDTAPLWYARGNVVLFNAVQQNIRQIWQTAGPAGPPHPLTGLPQNDSLRLLAAAPDGTGLLAVSSHNEADLSVLVLSSGTERVLTTQAGMEYAAYPAPQDEAILFHLNQQEAESPDLRLSELWHWSPAPGAQATRLAAQAFAPQWSPDGQQVAALLYTPPKSYDLQVMTAAGGAARVIARQLGFQGFTPRVPLQLAQPAEFTWLPDSQHIVYGAAAGALKRLHVGTQNEQTLAQLTGWQLTHPVVMATANRLAWAGIRNRQEWAVWSMPLDEAATPWQEPAALYATKDVLRLLGWRNETELLLALTPDVGLNRALPTEVRLCALSLAGEVRELLRLPQVYLPSLQLAPDARSVVYVQAQQGRDVIGQSWLAGKQQRILLNNPDPRIFFASPTWSKDGQLIYFSRQRQSYRLTYLQNLDLN